MPQAPRKSNNCSPRESSEALTGVADATTQANNYNQNGNTDDNATKIVAMRELFETLLEVSEMVSAKAVSAIDVCIDDVGSILSFCFGFRFDRLHRLVS